MRLNERHAAIAVLFLVAVLLVGFFWQDGAAQGVPLDQVSADGRLARVDETPYVPGEVHAAEHDRGMSGSLPMAGHDEVDGRVETVSTRGLGREGHRTEPSTQTNDVRPQAAPVTMDSRETVTLQPMEPSRGGLAGTLSPNSGSRANEREAMDRMQESFESSQGDYANAGGFLVDASADQAAPGIQVPASTDLAAERRDEAQKEQALLSAPVTVGSMQEYTVAPGDMLSVIATKMCGTSKAVDQICRLNGLSNPDKIAPGMVLQIPAFDRTRSEVASKAKSADLAPSLGTSASVALAAADGRRTITIRTGDLLSRVLVKELGTYKRSIALVKELNPGLNPDRLVVGQTIVLPLPSELPGQAVAPASRRRPAASEQPRLASGEKSSDDSSFRVR